MEDIFSDTLGLFGWDEEEDDGYAYYGGLTLGVVPKVFKRKLLFDRLIVSGCRRARQEKKDISGTKGIGNSKIRL